MWKTAILRGSIGLLILLSLVLLCTPGCDSSQDELRLSQTKNQELTQFAAKLEQQLSTSQNTNNLYKQRVAELEYQLKQRESQLSQAMAQLQRNPSRDSTTTTTTRAAGAGSTYKVAEGDSLWDIAEANLGNGIRYKEILALNPSITSEDTLRVGARLNLPSR